MKLVYSVVLIVVLLVSSCVAIQPETTPAPESPATAEQAASTPSDALPAESATVQENPTEAPTAIAEAPTSAPTATTAPPTAAPVEPTATALPAEVPAPEPVVSNCVICHSDQQRLIDLALPVEEPEDSLSSGVG